MVDMAVGQPDFLDGDGSLRDRACDVRQIAARIDHDRALGRFAPQQRAVLLKRGDRNNQGFCFAHGYTGPGTLERDE
jgi:hypothetical protein